MKNKNEKIKLFCIYHAQTPIYRNEVVEPILTGANSKDFEFEGVKDNSGDNISDKNLYYAELTANYWVWKNYVSQNSLLEYVGFCHYRRFFDFLKRKNKKAFKELSYEKFDSIFKKQYSQEKIYQIIKDYDIVLPPKFVFEESVYEQYCRWHPQEPMDKFIEIVKRECPEYIETMDEFLNSNSGYYCLNYIMKTTLYDEFFGWIYDLLIKFEKEVDLSKYYKEKNGEKIIIKVSAFIVERFINVWINQKIKDSNLKVLELTTYKLSFKKRLKTKILLALDMLLRKLF